MFSVELHNRGRVRRGTATVWSWRAILEAIKARHPGAIISPKHKADHSPLPQGRSDDDSAARGADSAATELIDYADVSLRLGRRER